MSALKFSIYNNIVKQNKTIYIYNSLYTKAVEISKKNDIIYFKKLLKTKKFYKE